MIDIQMNAGGVGSHSIYVYMEHPSTKEISRCSAPMMNMQCATDELEIAIQIMVGRAKNLISRSVKKSKLNKKIKELGFK